MRKTKNEEMRRLSADEFKETEKLPALLVLDDVRSAMNVGSAFRTGDAFRVEKIFLGGITARPPHREINKTALGAQGTVAWGHVKNTAQAIKRLKKEGYQVVAVEQADESISLLDFEPNRDDLYVFVFGNEVYGVADEIIEMSDLVLEIPQFGTKHSLNISVSIGIVLWDFLSKQKKLPF